MNLGGASKPELDLCLDSSMSGCSLLSEGELKNANGAEEVGAKLVVRTILGGEGAVWFVVAKLEGRERGVEFRFSTRRMRRSLGDFFWVAASWATGS